MADRKRAEFDSDLSMYRVTDPPQPDRNRLRWLRWITTRDTADGRVMAPPSGPLTQDEELPDAEAR